MKFIEEGMGRAGRTAQYAGAALLCCAAVHASLGQTLACEWDGALGRPGMTGVFFGVHDLHAVNSFNGAPALLATGFLDDERVEGSSCGIFQNGAWDLHFGDGNSIQAATSFDDGAGEAIYVGGGIYTIENVPIAYIARWDGTTWSIPGDGIDGSANYLGTFDIGDGGAVYAGGYFTMAGGQPAERIARWDGVAWSPLGGGMNLFPRDGCVFDAGSGPAIYFVGGFGEVDGQPADGMAAWDGSSWTVIETSASGFNFTSIYAIVAFDDGSGPALYVGGRFNSIGGTDAPFIARWDGRSWSNVGGGMNGVVYALGVAEWQAGADRRWSIHPGWRRRRFGPCNVEWAAMERPRRGHECPGPFPGFL